MSTTTPQTSIPHGRSLLRDPRYNRGTAFTETERSALGLQGLLPPGVMTLEQQAKRSYEQYLAQPTDLARNTFLAALHDRNEVLYYKLLEEHLAEMLPVVYDPDRVIPVMLDVGTDRESLLNDPLYVGNRHSRVRGERYDELIRTYIECTSRMFPNALLHFEDFGPSNARRILEQYRDKVRAFNDDVQGTGAITLAAILAGMRVAKTRPSEQRVVIFGSGTAGIGIAEQIREVMIRDGLSEEDATRRFWCVDKQGLLVDDMTDLRDFQQPYARPRSELADWKGTDGMIGLAEVIANAHPTILVGTSTVGGAFTEPIIKEMAAHVERPLIFPLSNPTERIEAVPADVIKWTEGRGLVGTGTPWDPVSYQGTDYEIGQANNALIYPGIGLGTIVSRASHVSDGMLLAASEAVAGLVDANRRGAGLLPKVQNLRAMSATVAVAIAQQAAKEGLAAAELADPTQAVQDAMWQAAYPEIEVS